MVSRKIQAKHLDAACFFAVEGQLSTCTHQRVSQRGGHLLKDHLRIIFSTLCLKLFLVSFVFSFFLAMLLAFKYVREQCVQKKENSQLHKAAFSGLRLCTISNENTFRKPCLSGNSINYIKMK